MSKWSVGQVSIILFACLVLAPCFAQEAKNPKDDHGYYRNLSLPKYVRVSSEVMDSLLEKRVPAKYPARGKGEAVVELQVTINPDGTVRGVRVVDGREPFAKSAKKAVLQYRYKPYLINGTPWGVDTVVIVRFEPPSSRP